MQTAPRGRKGTRYRRVRTGKAQGFLRISPEKGLRGALLVNGKRLNVSAPADVAQALVKRVDLPNGESALQTEIDRNFRTETGIGRASLVIAIPATQWARKKLAYFAPRWECKASMSREGELKPVQVDYRPNGERWEWYGLYGKRAMEFALSQSWVKGYNEHWICEGNGTSALCPEYKKPKAKKAKRRRVCVVAYADVTRVHLQRGLQGFA